MADINNTVGLDASGAINSLDKLSFSIDTVNQRIDKLNSRTKGDPFKTLNQNAAAAQKRIVQLQGRINQLEKQLRQTGSAGAKAGNEITVSWQTVGRVLQTQFLVRGLSESIRLFEEASEQAREFQLTIARTAAIAGGPGSSYEELSVAVRQLAVDLGQPLGEVQSASFQALQNDIADTTAASLDFVRVAGELAIATGSELETSVNSLTSILKSYGDEAGTAAQNSDILFRAVDVGRISLDELENRLGTITPQAAALGIEFRESAAAVSSLTLAGLDTARAATQLRNILAKLIRPTTTLQSAFERLGVTTGQELVQQYGGLQGALSALTEAFDGNETAVANAFGTIRGQLGVLNLLANEGSEFNRVLNEIRDSSGAVNEALQEVEATTARDFEKSLAEANDTLLGLGNSALEFKNEALELFNTLIPNSQRLEGALVAIGVAGGIAFANLAASAASASIAAIGLTGPIGILAVGLGAIAGITFANINTLSGSLERLEQASRNSNDAIEETFTSANEVIAERQEDNIRRQENLLRDFVKQSSQFFADSRRNFERENERIEISALRTTESFRNNRQSLISDLFGFIDSINGRIRSSFDRIQDATQDLEDIKFNRAQRGLSESARAANELARAQATAARASRQFAEAGLDEQAQSAALAVQATAEQQAREALRSAERLNNAALIDRAERNLINIVQQRINIERRGQQALQQIDQTRAREQADQAEAIRRRQAAITQELDALNQRRDEQGRLRDRNPEAFAQEERRIAELVQEFQALETELQGLEIIDQAGVRDQVDRAARALEQGINSVRFDLRGAVEALQSELNERRFQGSIELEALLSQTSVEAFQDELAAALTSGDVGKRTQQRLNATNDFIEAQRQAIVEQERAAALLEGQFAAIARTGEEAFQAPRGAAAFGTFFSDILRGPFGSEGLSTIIPRQQQEIEGYITTIGQLALQLKNEGEPAIQAVEQGLRDVGIEISQSPLQTQLPNAITLLNRQIQETEQAIKLVKEEAAASARIQTGEEGLQQLEQEAIQVAAQAGVTAREFQKSNDEVQNTAISTGAVDRGLQNVNLRQNQVLERQRQITRETLNTAAAAQQAAAASASAQARFFGGSVFRNFGGDLTRGQDQQLVAANAGEFFVNERSSNRFFSQLQAINAGQTPVFRDQGGPVTNIGDINVNVDARNSANVDGRQIARSINREIRRGSTTLRG